MQIDAGKFVSLDEDRRGESLAAMAADTSLQFLAAGPTQIA
jgi:hypothetical protein